LIQLAKVKTFKMKNQHLTIMLGEEKETTTREVVISDRGQEEDLPIPFIRGQRPLAPLGGDSSAHRTAQRTAWVTIYDNTTIMAVKEKY